MGVTEHRPAKSRRIYIIDGAALDTRAAPSWFRGMGYTNMY
jgi:hypothetical protein